MVIEIICLVLSALSLIAVIVLLILFFKKSKEPVSKPQDMVELGKLSQQIGDLKDTVAVQIKQNISEEIAKVQAAQIESNEVSNRRLNNFQNVIQESVEKKFNNLSQTVEGKLNDINKKVDTTLSGGFESTNKTINDVIKRLTTIDEAQKNIQNLSGDVIKLKDVLQNSQSRGRYGEFQLESILYNVFGDTNNLYATQYVIKHGDSEETTIRPDAVVFLPDPYKMVCIDSKFSFSSYNSLFEGNVDATQAEALKKEFKAAICKEIDDIRRKYIIKGKTIDQAIMFIPNDGIFAYIHVNYPDLIESAQRKNVCITSPSTLQAVLASIHMFSINYKRSQNLKTVEEQLSKLSKDFKLFAEEWDKFSRSVTSVSTSKEKLDKRVERINKKFTGITDNSGLEEIETGDNNKIEEKSIDDDDIE